MGALTSAMEPESSLVLKRGQTSLYPVHKGMTGIKCTRVWQVSRIRASALTYHALTYHAAYLSLDLWEEL